MLLSFRIDVISMATIKLFLIRLVDLVDHTLLHHRYKWLCWRISMSSWWGKAGHEATWAKREEYQQAAERLFF